jgi:spore coat protein CotH
VSDEELSQATGCAGVFNPDQVLDYYIEMAPGDFTAMLADQTNSIYFPAQLACGDQAPISVGIRRKRSGGTVKVGLKIDVTQLVAGQSYYGLRKLSLENGVSEGSTEDGAEARDYLAEYLGWRLMQRSGAISSRAAFARVHVNAELLGVYVNVEQVDKCFLESRLVDDSGWLYKKSRSDDDGLKTHETDGLVDPYEDYFCFWSNGGGACAAPPAETLAAELPQQLDIDQFLLMGAVNALIANTDSPIFKDNNFYYYDWYQGRVYIPWDLDTAMKDNYDVFAGGGGGSSDIFTAVLFSNWEGDYDAILTGLLAGELTLETILGEIARAETAASDAFASDPYISGTMAGDAESLTAYWTTRHAEVSAQVAAH